MTPRTRCILACLTLFASSVFRSARAASVWNETSNGDLSNLPLAPTAINLSVGSNTLSATMPGADLDFFTINIPAGTQLDNIFMTSYTGFDQISFIAIAPGAQVPASAVQTYDPAGLLGYAHFGLGIDDLGYDMLPELGITQFGVPGFSIPLASGTYSFWVQQESPFDTGYTFDFSVSQVPEPTSISLAALVGASVLFTRRRSS